MKHLNTAKKTLGVITFMLKDRVNTMKNKKTFETEYAARQFAETIDGQVRMVQLPGYMNVEIIWVVEY